MFCVLTSQCQLSTERRPLSQVHKKNTISFSQRPSKILTCFDSLMRLLMSPRILSSTHWKLKVQSSVAQESPKKKSQTNRKRSYLTNDKHRSTSLLILFKPHFATVRQYQVSKKTCNLVRKLTYSIMYYIITSCTSKTKGRSKKGI